MLTTIHVYDPPTSDPAKPLQSLEAYDAEKRARWAQLNIPQPNGIACPQCGSECQETALGPGLKAVDTQPPKWPIACSRCSWRGYRVAC